MAELRWHDPEKDYTWGINTGTSVITSFRAEEDANTTDKVNWLRANVGIYGNDWIYLGMLGHKLMKISFRYSEDALRFKLTFGD